jgi:murein DD-endopeptidase MepM/ murein hydrolase activator NlpD
MISSHKKHEEFTRKFVSNVKKWVQKPVVNSIGSGLFTIKKPVSRRFFQLGFSGLSPEGKGKIEQFANVWIEFFSRVGVYFFRKFISLLKITAKSAEWVTKLPLRFKSFAIKKLIWSRGRLGRTVATWVVLAASLSIFLLGEVFSGSTLVLNTSVSADYLVKTADIIPKKEIALTTVPEERKRAEAFVYKVEGGDTLYSIGTKFKISTDALQYVNGISESTVLQVGQELTIPPSLGLIHKVESGDTLSSIAKKYDVAPQAVADFNYLFSDSTLAVGSELVIPGAKVPQVVVPAPIIPGDIPSVTIPNVGPNKKLCVWPTTVRYISQNFFWYHNGIDIATPISGPMPPLLACTGGTVVRAGWDPFGLGLHVRIDHGNGYETVYGHMSRIDVSYGEKVKRGEVIGLMGSTGNSTGPHIHFMVKYKGVALDPLNYTN